MWKTKPLMVHLPCCFNFYRTASLYAESNRCLSICKRCSRWPHYHSLTRLQVMTLLIHCGVFNHCFPKESYMTEWLKTDEPSASSTYSTITSQPLILEAFWPRCPHTTSSVPCSGHSVISSQQTLDQANPVVHDYSLNLHHGEKELGPWFLPFRK